MAMKSRKSESNMEGVLVGVKSEFYFKYGEIGVPEVDVHLKKNYPCRYHHRRLMRPITITLPPSPTKEDHISKLPDDILRFIISTITMRERAATCILSRRWRNVWIESTSNLIFTDSNVLGHHVTRDLIKKKDNERVKEVPANERSLQPSPSKRKKGFLGSQRTKFIKRVNRILTLRRQVPVVDVFRVRFALVKESASHVDRWIRFAAAHGARTIKLDFRWKDVDLDDCNNLLYHFPVQQFASSSLNYLSLARCIIQFPPNSQGLNSLVSLTLTSCPLNTDRVQAILPNCPSLEFWSIKECCFDDFTTLSFLGPSTSLKHLDISECNGISDIELRDLNLLSFELQVEELLEDSGKILPEVKLSIRNCPLLTRLALHFGSLEASVQTLTNVPRLETLSLCILVSKMPKLSALSNLKHLVFSVECYAPNLSEVLCFLEACPLLQFLNVDMGINTFWLCKLVKESSKINTRSECPHSSLKEVEIYGFNGHLEQIELANYLLRNAMVLEKMKLCTSEKIYIGQGAWRLAKRPTYLRRSWDEIHKLLLKENCANTEVLIVSR